MTSEENESLSEATRQVDKMAEMAARSIVATEKMAAALERLAVAAEAVARAAEHIAYPRVSIDAKEAIEEQDDDQG